jgi:regulator of RNase E activity RraA
VATDDDLAARLGRLDACALSDALDRLGLPGCVTGLTPLTSTRRIAGRVHTLRLVAVGDATGPAGPARHLGTAAIEACAAGDVIAIEQRTGIDAASWGGILSQGAKIKGIAGVVADGPVRDVDEARALDFPVFARFATARTARGRIVEAATDGPITVGDVTVNPGDYVLADGSGVVFLAAAAAARVIAAAEDIAAREVAMGRALKEGRRITEVMGADYEHMLKR